MCFDLFGEIPVTVDELLAWCEAVAGIPRSSWRLAWYIRGWNVIEKIRAAKLAGTFDATIAAAQDPPPPGYAELVSSSAARQQRRGSSSWR